MFLFTGRCNAMRYDVMLENVKNLEDTHAPRSAFVKRLIETSPRQREHGPKRRRKGGKEKRGARSVAAAVGNGRFFLLLTPHLPHTETYYVVMVQYSQHRIEQKRTVCCLGGGKNVEQKRGLRASPP